MKASIISVADIKPTKITNLTHLVPCPRYAPPHANRSEHLSPTCQGHAGCCPLPYPSSSHRLPATVISPAHQAHTGRRPLPRLPRSRRLSPPLYQARAAVGTTRKMIYCNTLDPILVSASNSSRYQYWWTYQPVPIIDY
jgi:hypothetical protein